MQGTADEDFHWSAWRSALFPTLALLGIALPLVFLTWVERYLYYLRPVELLATFATAWLLLLAVAVPTSVVCWAVLRIGAWVGELTHHLRIFRMTAGAFVLGVAATAIVSALVLGFISWIRTFGLLPRIDNSMEIGAFVGCVVIAGLVVLTSRGRTVLARMYALATTGTVLGAVCLVSLPFMRWDGPASPSGAQAPTTASRPHIVLVTIDTLSAPHMSLYGAARPTTPKLEEFARAATTFDRAYANANFTTSGVASIMTGARPWTHRALQLPSWPETLSNTSVPAVLKAAGYQTGYVVANAWAGGARNGLGAYFDFHAAAQASNDFFCRDSLSVLLKYDCPAAELPFFRFMNMLAAKAAQHVLDPAPNTFYDPRVAERLALQWLASTDKSKPVFLWIHFMPPHSPYAAPSPWLGEFDSSPDARDAATSDVPSAYLFGRLPKERQHVLEARYDESVKYIDFYIDDFLRRALPQLGANTAVVISADHGESFEHGYGMHTGPGLFEPLIRIPLIIKLPLQTQGKRSSVIAEQVDIAPTLAELAGAGPASDWEGRSLLNLVRDDATLPEKTAYSMNFEENSKFAPLRTGVVAAIDGQWKFVHYMGALRYPLMPDVHDDLYDVLADPGELHDLISTQPVQAERIEKLIGDQLRAHGAPLP